jgi:hypothetical protein
MGHGTALPYPLRDYFRRLIDAHGEVKAAALVGVSRLALVRGIAGFPLSPGTLAIVREYLRIRRGAVQP